MHKLKSLLAGTLLTASALQGSAAFVGDRTDFRDETIYFAMTTRFYDGDPSNNVYCWDGIKNINDPEWRGDFKGLIDKLDYIKALGFTAVWITPIVENGSGLDYHGYHAMDFSKIDHRYVSKDADAAGADVEFQKLIDEVHSRDMKLILDIVIQHTGNFGEETLCRMFRKDYSKDLADIDASMIVVPASEGGKLPANYPQMKPADQYGTRLAMMKNSDFTNRDIHNYWHHKAWFDWDDPSRWWGQIAGDCVDLNTEHPTVTNYLVECYSRFIKMGVDGFRIDTAGHIPRLAFNKMFLPQFMAAAQSPEAIEKRGNTPFFMYGEVCARSMEVIYRGDNYNCSPCYYTWKESKDYPWDMSPESWDSVVAIPTQTEGSSDYETVSGHVNWASVQQSAIDDKGHSSSILRHSDNARLNGNEYHTPDYSQYSGLSVIDFAMHWNFNSASGAYGVRSQDDLYNDATYNVVYVDSHDYAPDSNYRFKGSQDTWAENLSLMFTFRGIPCIYYGSEVEFQKGKDIDKGAVLALKETGRAYFGGYIEGDVTINDFADYEGATGNMASTLSYPLALHIQRLNKIRAAVPALRKGQYSNEGCSGKMAFKRRYTDSNTDSYVLVTISGDATFTGVLNGRYVDAVTGDVQTVTNGTLTAKCSGKGNLRVYVLDTDKTKAPGRVGVDGKYLYADAPVDGEWTEWPDETMPDDTETQRPGNNGGGGGNIEEPENPIEPALTPDEQAVFFENNAGWGSRINCYAWSGGTQYFGSWSGKAMTYLGNNIYKIVYEGDDEIATDAGVIFNDGNNQTANLVWVNGGYYNASGLVKVIEPTGEGAPIVRFDPNGGDFVDNVTVKVKVSNATSAWYKIGNNAQVSVSGQAEFTIGSEMAVGQSVTVTWCATNGTETNTGQAVFTKIEKPQAITVYYDNSVTNWSTVKIHHWGSASATNWPGVDMTKGADGLYIYNLPAGTTGVVFNNGNGDQTNNITPEHNHIYRGTGNRGFVDDGINEAGVEIVENDAANYPVEYYNLQGIKVANPVAGGVYIRRQGTRADKVIYR